MPVIAYAFVLVIPALVAVGLFLGGLWMWAAPFFVYVLVPLLDLPLYVSLILLGDDLQLLFER